MSIYTKIFLINSIVILATMIADIATNNSVEKTIGNKFLGLWAMIWLISIPVWFIYAIVTY